MIMNFDDSNKHPLGYEDDGDGAERPSHAASSSTYDHGDDDNDDYGDDAPQELLWSGMGNIAAACDAANAVSKKPPRTEVERQHERRAANRRSAKMSRDRKKMEREQLQDKATRLAQANLALTKENQELRRQVSALMKRSTGQPPDHGLVDKGPSSLMGNLAGIGGMGSQPQQDLMTLQLMQQQMAEQQQQRKRSAAASSFAQSAGLNFQDLMSPAAGLMQGSQMAGQTLAGQRLGQNQQHLQPGSIASSLSLGGLGGMMSNHGDDELLTRELLEQQQQNKRQRFDPSSFN